jgi:hypothetical protein
MEPPVVDFDDVAPVVPTPSAAKTIGTLNIVFGALLLLWAVCSGAGLAMQPAMATWIEIQQNQARVQLEAARQQQIKSLTGQERAAKTAEDKAAIRAKRQALEAQPTPALPNMAHVMGQDDPRIWAYSLADIITTVILNVAMIVAGVGLLRFKDWGRRLGLWVALLKILALVGLYTTYIVVIVPMFSKRIGEVFEEMARLAPAGAAAGGPPLGAMGAMFGTMMAASAVFMMVAGAVYPAVVLWVLSRPGVREACSGQESVVELDE